MSSELSGPGRSDGNPVCLLRHPHCKRGVSGGQDRTKGAFGGRLTWKLAAKAKLLWGNCLLAMKNRQKSGLVDDRKPI